MLLGIFAACGPSTTTSTPASSDNGSGTTTAVTSAPATSETESSTPVTSEAPVSSEDPTTSEDTVDVPVTGVTLNKEATTLYISATQATPSETLTATVAPENATDATVSWTSSNENIVTVSSDGVITGLKLGSATVTATVGEFSASCEVSVKTELPSTITDKAVADFTTTEMKDGLYRVTGVVQDISNTTNGVFYLYDPVTGDSMYVYGLFAESSKETALYWNDGILKFSNPKNFSELGINEGDEITIVGIYYAYNATTFEFSGYLESINTDSVHTYTASVTTNSTDEVNMGTATLSKTSGIAFGEEITVTVTPASGYAVDSVSVHGKTLQETDGVYTFTAKVVNEVSVVFVSADGPVTIYQTGFESSEGFAASTVYNNVDPVVFGEEGGSWSITMGTVSTTSAISGSQSAQCRFYTNIDTLGVIQSNFQFVHAASVTFKASYGVSACNLKVESSADAQTWNTLETLTLTATADEYSVTISDAEEGATVYLRFAVAYDTAPTKTSRTYVDDIVVKGYSN